MVLFRPALIIYILFLLPFLARGASSEGPSDSVPMERSTFTIGIVTDGDTTVDRKKIDLFQQEIKTLAEEEFILRFPKNMILSGNDTPAGVNRALDRLYANPKTDLVLTLGFIGSSEVLRRQKLDKPTVAPYVVGGHAAGQPSLNRDGSRANLSYIDSLLNLNREILNMQKIVPFTELAVLIDQRDLEGIPEISRMIRRLANEHTMTITGVPVNTSANEALAAIPSGTEAVMVGALYHLSDDEQKKLVQGLIQRKLPGYSIWSRHLVDLGLLAGDTSAEMEEELARRTAISVQDILLGDTAGDLKITFARSHELTINMATARALDIYPSLEIMTEANLLNVQRKDIKRRLTLQLAVTEALQANLRLTAQKRNVAAGVHAVTEARSSLLPQIGVSTGIRSIDQDRAELSGGASPERAWTGSIGGSQQIYSEKSWAGYTVEKHKQTGREMTLETIRLDTIYKASVAYLDVLRAKAIEELVKDNLKLTQANLDRARIRMSTGVAGPDEVYRWETKFANDKQDVLTRESLTLDAMQALNRILNRPLQEMFIAEETDLSDPLLIAGDNLFFDLMNNPKYLQAFRDFAIAEALSYRTELKTFDAAIAAKERLKTAAGRAYWLPEFTVEGQVEQYFGEDGAGQRSGYANGLDDTDWQVGVYARLPLFEGGRKSGALNRYREELARLKIERRSLAERIGQEILQALNRTRASYPGINLSREAADAAQRNLKLITDSYVEGIKSIIDLLDAQNQALVADQTAANAVYNFLIDLMGVQRAMGEFVLFQSDEERRAWRERAEQYLQQGGSPEH